MAMKRIKNGDIIEISLENSFGFAYAKYLKANLVWKGLNLPDILRVFLYTSKMPLTNTSVINEELLLFAPISISGSIYKQQWRHRIVGNSEIRIQDYFLPFVKSKWPPLDPDTNQWVYFENLGDTSTLKEASYEQVRHLEFSRQLALQNLPFKITLELMKLEDYNIETLKNNLSWIEKAEFDCSYDLPPYSKLPDEIKGRVASI